MSDNPRTPKNLQGLFNFCVEATHTEHPAEDVASTSQFQAMTDEDKEFINAAIRAAMGSDPVKVMMKDLRVLTAQHGTDGVEGAESDSGEMEDALEDLQMHCENMDLANDFHKIGGYQVLPFLLQHPSPGLRWKTADLIATLVQNNPYSQEKVLEDGLMSLLLHQLDTDTDNQVRIKMLYAVSCLSRDFPPGEEELIKLDGFSHLLRAMQHDNDKLQTKSAFLLAYLCNSRQQIKDTLVSMGFVEQLVGLLHQPHAPYHEHLLRALLSLTDDHLPSVRECQREELQLNKILLEREKILQGKPESQEELEYTHTLLNRCFPECTTADR